MKPLPATMPHEILAARIATLESEAQTLRRLLEAEREISAKAMSEVRRLRDALGWTDGA